MATSTDVMRMLFPNGGWVSTGETFEDIQFIEATPITKAEFEAGFLQYDNWKAAQDLQAATAKAALLAKLGITAEEAALLLS
jgi:hypothetical protein